MASPWSGEGAGRVGEVEGEGSPPGCFLFMAITRVSCRGAVGTTGLGRSQGRRRAGARSTETRQNGRRREQRMAPGACRAGRVSLTPELSPVVKRRAPDHGTAREGPVDGHAPLTCAATKCAGQDGSRRGISAGCGGQETGGGEVTACHKGGKTHGRKQLWPQRSRHGPCLSPPSGQGTRCVSTPSAPSGGGRATAARNPRQRIPPATSRGRIFPRRRRPPGRHSGAGPSSLLRAEYPGRTGPRAPQAGRKGAK